MPPTMNSFRDFVATLTPTSYEITVDLLIVEYSQTYSVELTRADLAANSHVPAAGTQAASYAVLKDYYDTEQISMTTNFPSKIDRFKQDANDLLYAYEVLRDFAINDLQANLTDIKCGLNPVFENANILLNETAYCNEVGQIYGDMKDKSCIDLFNNFEYTNRSLLVVAIFSTFIGFLSVALGRRINRQFNLFNKKAWNFGEFQGGEKWQ